jgi:hypothetical protein
MRRPAEALYEERTRLAGNPLGQDEVGAQKIALRSSTRITITATTPAT